MRYNFCTLFDRNYASRGLALYQSLMRECKNDFLLTILCIDEETRAAFAKLALPRVRLWMVEDIGDAQLLEVRKTRPRREFCWTCPGPLMLALLQEAGPDSIVTYLDADLLFFSDVQPIFDELGDKQILIHGHRFAPRYEHYAAASGIFNVGLIAVRNAPQGMACLTRWRAQNMEMCVLDPENGYCGDQKYLDEWPSLYSSLVILQHPGVGVAPWNVEAHKISEKDGKVLIDGALLIFYHYHALGIVLAGRWARWLVVPSIGYDFAPEVCKLIYQPYVRELREASGILSRMALKASYASISPRHLVSFFRRRQAVIG